MDPKSAHITLNAKSVAHESGHAASDPLAIPIQKSRTISEMLALQVQAFLQATEEVDAEQETIDDILAVLNIEDDVNDEGGADQPPESEGDIDFEEEESSHDEDDDEILRPAKSETPPLPSTAEDAFTKQEVKEMMHYLKEQGEARFIIKYLLEKKIEIPQLLKAFGIDLCPELQTRKSSTQLYFLRVAINAVARKRDKLSQYNTIEDAVQLIQRSQRIWILSGAGISVSCGIPDFRSRDGLYASLKNKGEYELDDPQQMFDIDYFRENPAVFYSFASQIYPSNFIPSPCHRFIKLVEDQGKLLLNYTQNIDTLETQVGVNNVLQCHGSFATASCLQCRRRVPGKEIEADILNQKVPLCTVCNTSASAPIKPKAKKKGKKKAKGQWDSNDEDESDGQEYPPGIMKPDITFFGEPLTEAFKRTIEQNRDKVDLLLIMGTSLKVAPVSDIISVLPHSVPQILINKTPIRHINPDIILLGNADDIVIHLTEQLHWELPPPSPAPAEPERTSNPEATRLQPPRTNLKKRPSTDNENRIPSAPKRVGESHVWLFDGAEGGKWLQQLHRELGIPKSVPPSVPGSGYNTRSSTPALGPSPARPTEGDVRRESKKPRIA